MSCALLDRTAIQSLPFLGHLANGGEDAHMGAAPAKIGFNVLANLLLGWPDDLFDA